MKDSDWRKTEEIRRQIGELYKSTAPIGQLTSYHINRRAIEILKTGEKLPNYLQESLAGIDRGMREMYEWTHVQTFYVTEDQNLPVPSARYDQFVESIGGPKVFHERNYKLAILYRNTEKPFFISE